MPKGYHRKDFTIDWREDIKIAKQLMYPAIVIELLERESNADARQRILADARKGKYNKSR